MCAENLVRKVLKVTVDQVMAWEPCEDNYPRERVEELFAGREALSAMEFLELDIPAKDILWAALREELVPAETLHKFTCRCNEADADAAWSESVADSAAWAAIMAAAMVARDAACDANRAEAWNTAYAAAWDTARSAQAVILQTLLREAEEELDVETDAT